MSDNPAGLPAWAGPFLVDTHVHLHPCFQVGDFFDAAERNFRRAASALRAGGALQGVLVLTEGARESAFTRLANGTLTDASGRWAIAPGEDELSALASSREGAHILVIAGRQIVSREKLEVLIVGSRANVPDGRPFGEVVAEAVVGRGVVVLPWGFGKWTGRRGELVRDVLESVEPASVFVADNGGRPRGLGLPQLLEWAVDRGHGLLRGSDPLPLAWQVSRAGSYGSEFDGSLSVRTPARALAELIRAGPASAPSFGVRDSWPAFVRAQLGIRLAR